MKTENQIKEVIKNHKKEIEILNKEMTTVSGRSQSQYNNLYEIRERHKLKIMVLEWVLK